MKPKMKPTIEKNARLTAAAPVENRGSLNSAKSSKGYSACLSRRTKPRPKMTTVATVIASSGDVAPHLGPSMTASISAVRRHEPGDNQHPDERERGANQHRQTQRIRECRLRRDG